MKKEKNSRGRWLSVQKDSHFSLCSVPLPISPSAFLYLLSFQPIATCHPSDTAAGRRLMRMVMVKRLYSHFHFQRNTSHCHQIPARLSVKRRRREQVGNYPRQRWKLWSAQKWCFVRYCAGRYVSERCHKHSLTVAIPAPGLQSSWASFPETRSTVSEC